MPSQEVELILMRQLANYLNLPIFVVGNDEKLLFYNEAAGLLLGRAYDEAGQVAVNELSTMFQTVSEDGVPLPPEELPVTIAVREHRPAHRRIVYHALDGVRRTVEVAAFPLEGQAGRALGAIAIFWEVDRA